MRYIGRLVCWFVGCHDPIGNGWCRRCSVGSHLSGWEFGNWWWVRLWPYYALRRVVGRRCEWCGKWFRPRQMFQICCCADCASNSIPF